jgi:hypothetical protein
MFTINTKNTGIGNQMFKYALCRIAASKNGFNFYIQHQEELKSFFPNLDFGIIDGTIRNTYYETENQIFDENVFKLEDFTHLEGYFQSEKYFADFEDEIKSWFKLEMDDETEKILNTYPIDSYCYIHLRGGDYFESFNYVPTREYYNNGLQEIKNDHKDIKFLIITDDIETARKWFPEFPAISNNRLTDFKCLYFSKFRIISASTFSWWACWLGDSGKTYAPNYWLNHSRNKLEFYPYDIKSSKFEYF